MKKIITILSIFISLLVSPTLTYAVDINTCPQSGSGTSNSALCSSNNQSSSNPIISALKIVLDVISYIAGIIAVISLIIAGFKMILGGGNADQYNSAKNMILFVIIGIAVVILSQTIVIFVLNKLS